MDTTQPGETGDHTLHSGICHEGLVLKLLFGWLEISVACGRMKVGDALVDRTIKKLEVARCRFLGSKSRS